MKKSVLLILVLISAPAFAQTKAPPSTASPTPQTKAPPTKAPPTPQTKPTPKPAPAVSDSDAVLAAFDKLLDGIRHADLKLVTSIYWNSPHLNLFNYNGSVTKGWEQMRKNRESSYPEIKDVKLDVRDKSLTMLGRDAALVTCQWTQSQNYKGTPETASGRMTLVFKKFGTTWKAIHLHSSPDSPNPASIPPSEQIPTAAPPTPSPSPSPSATPAATRPRQRG
jgi:ketosteroid isomerase-like protein